ncbi:calvin cycle protein CP12-1, chloroplastic-like [Phragmites australis]|uniref:calvin cycle protein CP12-1, chloroplastic-like n=1 Tax=Phragmites australis TaxID=29695 RepID=UPI002D78DC97|nr:calvin cycle protein CP12-1, chloroplastic-like [Phragmites australis]
MATTVTAMAAIAAFPAPRTLPQPPAALPSLQNVVSFVVRPVRAHRRLVAVAVSSPATPPDLASKVSESIKQAQETCADDPVSGECVAAWDEVEELSAAASHARDRQKGADPLEEYCKDNPETDECRTYED